MRWTSLLWTLVILCVGVTPDIAQTKAAATAAPFRITGVVVGTNDGAPVSHCHLTATQVPRNNTSVRQFPAPLETFDCDEHGRFSIPLPSAGMWRVTASAPGYVTQAYNEHEEFSSGIVLTTAVPTMDLRFRIAPEGVITGKVLDEAGEPVRRARVSLLKLAAGGADEAQPQARTRGAATTDDRGVYEFDNLPPGDYRIRVQAQVWYAVAAQPQRQGVNEGSEADPSLDVVYPLTWYPGTSDANEAETISLRAGDNHEADLQLHPVPSMHLRIMPSAEVAANGRRIQAYPMVERVSSDGNAGFVPVSIRVNSQGVMDIGGLTPGQYEITMQAPGERRPPALVDVVPGSAQVLDPSAPSAMANVSIQVEGIPEPEASSVQIGLFDPETGRSIARRSPAFLLTNGVMHQRREVNGEHVLEVPPGHYQVAIEGRPDLFLTDVTAQFATATGKLVTVPSGNSMLVVHVAKGKSSLQGFVMHKGKPVEGAMVVLVPATLGEATGINIIRRDQSNTDGSYDLYDVLPGQYILLAIDDGWHVNWRDASTLQRYMMNGTPIDLAPAANIKQDVEAQAP
ncbi:MAG TPA: carboxypeptidase regulatory-like domain-containing protein [Edaphobacter sp.]|nr:carboxypeptidase regulatory-like domain-containing protein [Edaphobacter sp.]